MPEVRSTSATLHHSSLPLTNCSVLRVIPVLEIIQQEPKIDYMRILEVERIRPGTLLPASDAFEADLKILIGSQRIL